MEKRKLFTLLLVGPHGNPWKIRIPLFAVYGFIALMLGVAVGLTALASSYARMLLKVSNYNHMRADRQAMKTNYKILESVVKHTDTQLNSLESLASEVAESYGFGRTQELLADPLSAGAHGRTTSETTYDASLYAFNRIEQAATGAPPNSMLPRLLASARNRMEDIPSIWPVRGEVTSGFGERIDPINGMDAFHGGMDIAAPSGTAVHATADGIVLEAGREEAGYGIEVVIDHGYGITTRYAHLRSVFVIEGQEVRQGQVIGAIGMTGRSTGPHLHYEVLVHETPVNPANFLHG